MSNKEALNRKQQQALRLNAAEENTQTNPTENGSASADNTLASLPPELQEAAIALLGTDITVAEVSCILEMEEEILASYRAEMAAQNAVNHLAISDEDAIEETLLQSWNSGSRLGEAAEQARLRGFLSTTAQMRQKTYQHFASVASADVPLDFSEMGKRIKPNPNATRISQANYIRKRVFQ